MSAPIDFAAAGLLDGLEGDARSARLALLEHLAEQGVGVEELRRAVAEDRLALVPAERMFAGDEQYTGAQVAALAGMDPDFLGRLRTATGLPTPAEDDAAFTELDVELARTTQRFLAEGIAEEWVLEVARVLNRGLAHTAETMRTSVLEAILRPGDSEHELGMRYAQSFERLAPLVAPLLEQALLLHMRELVRTDVISASERATGRLPGARDVAVCFADLVGFTRLGESVPVDELGRIAGRLGEIAAAGARPPVRLVKTIGDAAMLVSPDASAALEVAFDLLAAVDEEGEAFPQLRAGLAYGPALNRGGDWYGQTVNLASRVTAIARPGSVLVTREVRAVTREAFAWSMAGARRLKGIPEPVALYRARRPRPAGGEP